MDILLTISVVSLVAGFFALIFSNAINPGARTSPSNHPESAFQANAIDTPVFQHQTKEKNYWKVAGYTLMAFAVLIRIVTLMP